MILREIKNMYIKNRLTEGVDYEPYEWLGVTTTTAIRGGILTSNNFSNDLHHLIVRAYRPTDNLATWRKFYYVDWEDANSQKAFGIRCNDNYNGNVFAVIKNISKGFFNYQVRFAKNQWKEVEFTWGSSHYMRTRGETSGGWDTSTDGMNYTTHTDIRGREMVFSLINDKLGEVQLNQWYFKGANGTIDLHPCKLIKDIPAGLSQDNSAHYVGECGLYNKINGKFWFIQNSYVINRINVNINSGLQQIYQNRLVEGVDYETYDWLKADIPTSTVMMSLPINSKNFEFQRNWIQIMNSGYFDTSGSITTYAYFITDYINTDVYKCCPRICERSAQTVIYNTAVNVGLGIHTIIANDNAVTISSATNTATLPWYGNQVNITFNNSADKSKHTIHLTSSIKVDGVTRYVPCQLLHSIPRNLDAQCKERVAGECGMIDLIMGKFYGNVANSGTFTVENDSN